MHKKCIFSQLTSLSSTVQSGEVKWLCILHSKLLTCDSTIIAMTNLLNLHHDYFTINVFNDCDSNENCVTEMRVSDCNDNEL